MKQEIEAKYYPIDKNEIERKLNLLKAQKVTNDFLMKRVVYDGRSNPGIKGTYARIRVESDKITMSIKVNGNKDGKITDQKELQIVVDSFENTKEFLDGVGLQETNYQENYRTIWKYKDSEIVIDTWPALESYLEIESPDENELKEIFNELGLTWDKKTIVSTDELYAQKYNITKIVALKALSYITFDNIPSEFKSN